MRFGSDTVLPRHHVKGPRADASTLNRQEAKQDLIDSGQALWRPMSVDLLLEWQLRSCVHFTAELLAP